MTADMTYMNDSRQIDTLIEAAYDLLAFEPGGLPQWSRFFELFSESAILALRVFPADLLSP